KWKEIKQSIKTIFKGGIIGTVVGALPGSGDVISSFLSYNEAVRSSKKPEQYGKGELDGVAASESGAVGTEASAFIPLLTLGIPGDVGSAIILSAMILHGIEVGPQLFSGSGEIVKALFGGMIIIEIGVLSAAWFGSTLVSKIVKIPSHYLFSVVSVLIVSGAFALENNMFNVWVTFAFGLLGYILLKFNYPLPPLLLGLILGPIIEKNFLLATSSSGGDWFAIITRPITAFILILAMISMFLSIRIKKSMINILYFFLQKKVITQINKKNPSCFTEENTDEPLKGMAYIPEGEFLMGTEIKKGCSNDKEGPVRNVNMKP